MKALMLVLLLLIPVTVGAETAAQKRCHRCKPRHPVCTPRHVCAPPSSTAVPAKAEEPSVWQSVLTGFEVTAGFRWDYQRCLDDRRSTTPTTVQGHDPFFVGAQLRLPITENYGAFVSGDRDFVDDPQGNVRVGLYFKPFYHD
jgi:hypothetical protein